MSLRKQEPIAIVGIGCLFPKAPSLQDYWKNILDARDCISDVPEDHSWSVADFYDADPNKKDRSWCTRGGFLDKLPFDPIAYGIPPNQLESIDTSQLLSLICAREALKDAGINPDGDDWDRDNVGVILGCTGTQEMAVNLGARLHGPRWRKALKRCGVEDDLVEVIVEDIGKQFPTWTEQSFPGLLGNVVAGRITNRLNLGSTNCVVDAACASSLAAIQYAMSDLASGRSDMVLTGGVDTLNDSFMFQCFTRTPAFSQSNNARPFDKSADGILIGEGIAIMAMKRLADAERDGDRIYAVIRGLGSSSDGKGKSIYAPNASGQAKALKKTYSMADISPSTVELIEAHGTGTKAGDMAEIQGLLEVYTEEERTDRWVALGSVKSQIGHTKSTAGAAGMVKAALSLYHKVLPPTIKVDELNPKMGLEKSPFYLNTIARPWIRNSAHPRRAGVSAFGFGGSNFHAILEEHASEARPVDAVFKQHQLMAFSADSSEALLANLKAFSTTLSESYSLAHSARTSLENYTPASLRLSFVATSVDDAIQKLNQAIRSTTENTFGEKDGVYFGKVGPEQPKLAIVFPGQGSQYPNMGRSLAIGNTIVRDTINRAEESLYSAGRDSLARRMFPIPAFSNEERKDQAADLQATEWAQPALGAISAGMLSLLNSYGVKADAVAGHSYGELVALHAAEVIDENTLWELSRIRGEAMADNGQDRGTMAAISGSLEAISAAIERNQLDVVLANRNHPNQGVISGSKAAIDKALPVLEAQGLSGQRLNVSAAFHSDLVADATTSLTTALRGMTFNAPVRDVYANATGALYPTDSESIKELLAQQITSPVHFVEIAQALYESGSRLFIECGPKRILQGLLTKTLGDDVTVISLNPEQDRQDADRQFTQAIAQLIAAGVNVDLGQYLELPLPAAIDTKLSPATVHLAGANYLNESTKNPPLPTLPKRPVVRQQQPVQAQPQGPIQAAPVSKESTMKKTAPQQPTAPAVDHSTLQQLLAATQQTLSAFQQAQERAAKVHTEFLHTHAKATDTFAQLFQTHAQLIGMASGQGPMPVLAPAANLPQVSVPPKAQNTIDTLIPGYTGSAPLQSTSSSPIALDFELNISTDLPPLMDANSVLGKSAAKPASPPPVVITPAVDIQGALLCAVAEKTGYPQEMLELSMHMESDLGIDSIKRVEIMAAVQEKLPSLPEIDNERLSAMQTLQEVFNCLDEANVSAPASAPVTVTTIPSAADVETAMLAAVAVKTGYPQEMLELSMHMESDLGIDSIKRVEIMAAVQEDISGLPDVDNERLSTLQTLQEVVDYLLDLVGTISPTPPPAVGIDLQSAVFSAVAEKTGYPVTMLEPSMDMESDLGIDSIKRVEIMAAVQESIPGLPEIDNDLLSSSRTLADIIKLLTGYSPSSPTPPASSAQPNSSDIAEALKATVALKTGYPKEMLSLDMDMESDLGIDSIKRVEIMAALQEEVEGLPELDNDRLSSLKTLQEVLSYVQELLGTTNETPQVLATKSEPTPIPEETNNYPTRRLPTLVPIALGQPTAPEGPILITKDLGDVATTLGAELRERGHEVILLEADWSSPSSIKASLPETVHTVIHAAAIGANGDELAHRVRGAFLLANAVGSCARFVTLASQGGHFGLDGTDPKVLEGSLAGLTKTIALEWNDCTAIAIDMNPSVSPAQIADAALSDGTHVELGLTDIEVLTIEHPEVPLSPNERSLPVEPGDLIVVSGGARGVTAAVGIEMAKRWQPTLLLLGRSTVDEREPDWAKGIADSGLSSAFANQAMKQGKKPSLKDLKVQVEALLRAREVRKNLERMRTAGATVTYVAVDVRDPESVHQAITAAVEQYGPVKGLVHGAGVLADKFIADKTAEQFDKVFQTKVDGLTVILNAISRENLKMLALFTSVAGRYGNRGQCDYAMANEALTRMGIEIAQQGVRVKAFDWGPWDGGMVNEGLSKQFKAAGIELIGLTDGAHFFCEEFEANDGNVEVIVGGPSVAGSLIQESNTGEIIKNLEENEPYLRDHRIAGSPVLPAAMALEWIARAAQDAFPKLHFVGIRDFKVINGVILKSNQESLTLRWTQVPREEAQIGLRSFNCELISPNEKLNMPKVHYKGVVDLAIQQPQQRTFPGSNGLGANRYPYQVDEAYRRFLFHGPSLRGIQDIVGYSDHGMVARLNSSAPEQLGQPGGAWKTDPVAIDCALQMMLLWVREKYGNTALPSSVGEYRQYQAFVGPVTCHLVMDSTEAKQGSFHATFVSEDGMEVARFDSGRYVATPKRIAFGEA